MPGGRGFEETFVTPSAPRRPDAERRMHVRALFFATYRDLVGHPSLDVSLPADATVTDLVATLRGRGAPWDRLPGDPAVAVNHEYSAADRALAPGDEVAFIPPVAGG